MFRKNVIHSHDIVMYFEYISEVEYKLKIIGNLFSISINVSAETILKFIRNLMKSEHTMYNVFSNRFRYNVHF